MHKLIKTETVLAIATVMLLAALALGHQREEAETTTAEEISEDWPIEKLSPTGGQIEPDELRKRVEKTQTDTLTEPEETIEIFPSEFAKSPESLDGDFDYDDENNMKVGR